MFQEMNEAPSICQTCLSSDRKLRVPKNIAILNLDQECMELLQNTPLCCWECQSLMAKFTQFREQVKFAQMCLKNSCKVQLEFKSLSKLTCTTKTSYDTKITHNDQKTVATTDSKLLTNEEASDQREDRSVFADVAASNKDYNETLNLSKLIIKGKRKTSIYFDSNEELTCNNLNTDFCEVRFDDNDLNKIEITKTTLDTEKTKDKETSFVKKKLTLNKRRLKTRMNVKSQKDTYDIDKLANDDDCATNDEQIKNKLLKIESDEDYEGKYEKIVLSEEEMLKTREEKKNGPNYKKIPYKCETCVLGFLAKENYDAHWINKHDKSIGDNVCPICVTRFKTKIAAENHKTKHYTRYKCKMCKYETLEVWAVHSHVKVKHKSDTSNMIHCTACDKVFRTPEDLSQHLRAEHTVTCDECGAKFKGKNTLLSHLRRIHHSNRQHSCPTCKMTFKSASRLESHLAAHSLQLAYCRLCDVQYKNIYVYRNHLKNSKRHVVNAYQCSICEKKFASKDYLRRHCEFFHLKKSKFQCERCDKLFMSRWSLKNHNQTHHGMTRTRNYQCNICDSKFFSSSTLKGHQLLHSDRRNFMCAECGDTFRQGPSLYTHIKLVHEGVKRQRR